MARYETSEEIGQGGTGKVFMATDRDTGRRVALKRFHDQLADDSSIDALLIRETRQATALKTANIVVTYQAGRDEHGLFVAMEYIAGGSLADRLERTGPLNPVEAIALIRQVGTALGACHQAGFHHGNVKPANVLLDSAQRPKLSDFGSASLILQDELTRELAGSEFLAPELLGDDPMAQLARLDARSDVYGLAATLYATLTGESPRQGAAWRVPPNLRPVLQKALAEAPAERYQRVDDFLNALSRAVGGKATKMASVGVAVGLAVMLVAGVLGFLLVSGDAEESEVSVAAVSDPVVTKEIRPPDPVPLVDRATTSDAVAPQPAPKAELVQVNVLQSLSTSGYALGFVENTGQVPLEKPRVDLEFFDAQERSLMKGFGYASFDLLKPGERSPVKILLKPYPKGWSRYEPKVKARPPYVKSKRLARLAVVEKSLQPKDYGNGFDALVLVRNDDQVPVKFIEATVVLFDEQDKIISIGSGYVDERPLEPGGQGNAKVMLLTSEKSQPKRYQVFLDATVYPKSLK